MVKNTSGGHVRGSTYVPLHQSRPMNIDSHGSVSTEPSYYLFPPLLAPPTGLVPGWSNESPEHQRRRENMLDSFRIQARNRAIQWRQRFATREEFEVAARAHLVGIDRDIVAIDLSFSTLALQMEWWQGVRECLHEELGR